MPRKKRARTKTEDSSPKWTNEPKKVVDEGCTIAHTCDFESVTETVKKGRSQYIQVTRTCKVCGVVK